MKKVILIVAIINILMIGIAVKSYLAHLDAKGFNIILATHSLFSLSAIFLVFYDRQKLQSGISVIISMIYILSCLYFLLTTNILNHVLSNAYVLAIGILLEVLLLFCLLIKDSKKKEYLTLGYFIVTALLAVPGIIATFLIILGYIVRAFTGLA